MLIFENFFTIIHGIQPCIFKYFIIQLLSNEIFTIWNPKEGIKIEPHRDVFECEKNKIKLPE